jgi:hypothetical protein
MADERTYVFDKRMADYGAEPTPECPADEYPNGGLWPATV